MNIRICSLATAFLRNTIGAPAAFILVGSFNAVASAETQVERGSYLVNSIGACGNCDAREADGRNLHPGITLAGGWIFDEIDPGAGHVIAPNITPDRDTGIGKWSEAEIVTASGPMIRSRMPLPTVSERTVPNWGDQSRVPFMPRSQPPISMRSWPLCEKIKPIKSQ
jgi:hypothetical protein